VNQAHLFTKEPAIKLVGFDDDQGMEDEKALTGMGPRPAGSDAEMAGAEYVAGVFDSLGLETTIWTYEMKVFEVNTAEVSLVKYGPLKRKPMFASPGYIKEYTDKTDFVLQGFSGSRLGTGGPLGYRSDLLMAWVGNGTDDNPNWAACSGVAGIVTQEKGTPSATAIMRSAMANNCAAVILHNTVLAAQVDYLPIFKGIYFSENESDPTIPMFMTSKAMGDELMAGITDSKLRLNIDVTVEVRSVPVVEGILRGGGKSMEWVAIGGHMDTVYNGPGAVDNTAGTVAVLGLARSMAGERPKRDIRFLTFGAEEIGLRGAAAYVENINTDVEANCVNMLNLDMPNIDIERSNTGWMSSTDNGTVSILKKSRDKLTDKEDRYSKYDITIEFYPMSSGSDNVIFHEAGIPATFAAGGGSYEYHTYKDDITRINPESIGFEARIVGSTALYFANK